MGLLRLVYLALALLASAAAICQAKASFSIHLRTGVLTFHKPSRSSKSRLRSLTGSISEDGASSPTAASGPPPSLPQAYFITYDRATKRDLLYKYLRQNDASVQGFIPENTWLVTATPDVATGAMARQLAVRVAPCLPEHKVAPEWSGVVGTGGTLSGRSGEQPADGAAAASDPSAAAVAATTAVASSGTDASADSGAAAPGVSGSGASETAAAAAAASANYDAAVQEGGVNKYVITAQLFSAPSSTAAEARAAAERLASFWRLPLLDHLRADTAKHQQQSQEQQPDGSSGASGAAAAATATASPQQQPNALSNDACAPVLRARGRRLTAAVCGADLAAALHWLSAQREVHWLEPTPQLARRDLWGNLVLQLGGRSDAAAVAMAAAASQPSASGAAAAAAAAQPFWSRGLDGRSQLLGISDSGVDTDSCYFFDPMMPNVGAMLAPDPSRRGTKLFRSELHRKIASYYCYADFGDADGHGTHVAGIALGACHSAAGSTGDGSGQSSGPQPPSPQSQRVAALVAGPKRKKNPPPPPSPLPPKPPRRPPPRAPPPPLPPSPPPASPPLLTTARPPSSPTPLTPPTPSPQRRSPSPAIPVPRPPLPPQPRLPSPAPPPPPPPLPSPTPLPPTPTPASAPAAAASTPNGETTRDAQIVVQSQPYVIDQATGMAPGARLAFYDIMDPLKNYRLPPYEDILQYQLDAGVFVQSDSWGSKQAFWYNSLCEQLDGFVWRNPQLLVLTAAGNDGALSPRPVNGTVSAPANAKNTLSVGSTFSIDPYDTSTGDTLRLRLWTDAPNPPDSTSSPAVASLVNSSSANGGVNVRAVAAAAPPPPPPSTLYVTTSLAGAPSFSLLLDLPATSDFRTLQDLGGAVLEAVAAVPAAACRRLTNVADVQPAAGSGLPKLVLALRGGCLASVKAVAATAAGAAALAVINDAPETFTLQFNPSNLSLPAAPLPQGAGQMVLAALAAGVRVYARGEWYRHRAYDDVPSYSAYGPTVDGRIKPDLLAPGVQVLSAGTDGVSRAASDNCTIRRVMTGTSMSAPLVAGAAVLARQYFTSGYYPLGRNDTPAATPFAPSGMLLKAVLIGGAYDMQGMSYATQKQLDSAPSAYQGFGRVDLLGALPLTGASPPASPAPPWEPAACAAPSLQLVDSVPIREGDVHSYQLTATGDGPVVVTLVWPDPPADPLALIALVNDLDLEVSISRRATTAAAPAAGGAVLLRGNSGWAAARANKNDSSAGAGVADRRNNVERVTVPAGQPGAPLLLRVRAAAINSKYVTRFAADEQQYALTVHGCFSGLLVSERNPDPRAWPKRQPLLLH